MVGERLSVRLGYDVEMRYYAKASPMLGASSDLMDEDERDQYLPNRADVMDYQRSHL